MTTTGGPLIWTAGSLWIFPGPGIRNGVLLAIIDGRGRIEETNWIQNPKSKIKKSGQKAAF
jgi:hypothetical protein